MIEQGKHIWNWLKGYLSLLSFKSGVVVLILCALFYLLSFAVLTAPIEASMRALLWTLFFGLAKTAQYTALLILGAEGVKRVKALFGRKTR